MREDGELEPGAVGTAVIGGNHVESKLPLEFREGVFLRAAAVGEVPQVLRGEAEIGRHRGVFEVTVVGGEQIELVILRAQMVNSLAVNYDPQLKSPDRQLKLGLEAIDISSDRRPARLGGDQRFYPGPLTEGHFDRVGATPAGEQLEEILLEKGRVHAEFQRQRAPQAPRISPISSRTKRSAPLESWTLPGRFL